MAREPCEVFDNFLSKIIPGMGECDIRNKKQRINEYIIYTLNRTSQMFKWDNLPDTIPQRTLELYLQCNGNVCIYKHNGQLYPFVGGLGGEPNVYYMPTLYTIANPALNISVNAVIDKNCIVIPNDTLYNGLMPMIRKYATLLVENELTLFVNLINSRLPSVIGASDTREADSARMLFKDIESGKLGVIGTNQLFEGFKSLPYSISTSHTLTDILEVEQYLKASLYNDLGLQSNYNMKRERLTDDETALNENALLPLIDDMLLQRKKGAKRVNDMFDTNIDVKLNSGWKLTQLSARVENSTPNETNTNEGGGENDL